MVVRGAPLLVSTAFLHRAQLRVPQLVCITSSAFLDYSHSSAQLERCSSPEPPPLVKLRAETSALMPQAAHMVSGTQQGRLLHMITRLANASRVLEIGCFTGYATMWMAAALPPHGMLLALERDEAVAAVARRHLEGTGLMGRVELRLGDALQSLAQLPADAAPFDLIFLDADKRRYAQYYKEALARGLLAPHGLLVADNILWKWQVLSLPWTADRSSAARAARPPKEALNSRERRLLAIRDAMHAYNVGLSADTRVQQLVLPLRDGLNIAQLATARTLADAAVAPEAVASQASTSADAHADPASAMSAVEPVSAQMRLYLHRAGGGEPAALTASREAAMREAPAGVHALVGPQQGRLLHMLARLARATRVLQVGSGQGYATMWLASALADGSEVVVCDPSADLLAAMRRRLLSAGLLERVQIRQAGVLESLQPSAHGGQQFDLIVVHAGLFSTAAEAAASLLSAAQLLTSAGLFVLPASAESTTDVRVVRGLADQLAPNLVAVTLPSPDGLEECFTLVGHLSELDRPVRGESTRLLDGR